MRKLCTTEEVVKALENRDSTVLADIQKNYGALLRRIAVNLGLNSGDTEECMNDTYLEVWNTIPPAKPKSIRSYVCMLMRRIAIDRIRYNSAEKRANTVYIEVSNELESCMDVENTVIDEMCIPTILNQFLENQTSENREIFIRRYYEFEATREIAHDMMIGVNTLEKRLSRMRAELKRILKEWGYN
ncbi:MAG: sigma-70 family RNA polymerase sigma factor [Clostridia bacterium]|nr:sigma-70 family RNA polymerase sigma factor [Clostridia bacterium]